MPLNLKPDSLDWALRHVERFGDTDIFPIPFEYTAIRSAWSSVPPQSRGGISLHEKLSQIDVLEWTTRPFRRCLTPKHQFGFRVSTQLDPLDTLLITALIYELGEDLEAYRIPAADATVHSYRFRPDSDGRMYDQEFHHGTFKHRATTLAAGAPTSWIVVADIADFYPRIYSHPLENALVTATPKREHVAALTKMLHAWNFNISYGIPVGPSATRLLAEVAITDIDHVLRSESYTFARFVDDYMLVCDSERRAYEGLALLARALFDHHGLTLQQHKTTILTAPQFLERYDRPEEDTERQSLADKFEALLEMLEIENPYQAINYEELTPEQKAQVDSLNLLDLLLEQVEREDMHHSLAAFALRRLGQTGNADAIDIIMNNMHKFYPILRDVVRYLQCLGSLDSGTRNTIAERLLDAIEEETIGHLEYHRAWILSLFTLDSSWNHSLRLSKAYSEYADEFSRRESILALGRANQQAWFKSRKRNVHEYSPWLRRAFIAAASCLPGDEAEHWYRSLRAQLDPLEQAIVGWARANRFP